VLIKMSVKEIFVDSKVRKLAKAAGDGDIDLIEQMLNQVVDVNARGVANATPLMDAAQQHQFGTALQLLKLGADHRIINGNGKTLRDVLNTYDGLLDPKSKEAKALGKVNDWLGRSLNSN
jgi:ankyrin repeat protein